MEVIDQTEHSPNKLKKMKNEIQKGLFVDQAESERYFTEP